MLEGQSTNQPSIAWKSIFADLQQHPKLNYNHYYIYNLLRNKTYFIKKMSASALLNGESIARDKVKDRYKWERPD